MARSIAEINERIKTRDAVVLTAQEVCAMVKSGEELHPSRRGCSRYCHTRHHERDLRGAIIPYG